MEEDNIVVAADIPKVKGKKTFYQIFISFVGIATLIITIWMMTFPMGGLILAVVWPIAAMIVIAATIINAIYGWVAKDNINNQNINVEEEKIEILEEIEEQVEPKQELPKKQCLNCHAKNKNAAKLCFVCGNEFEIEVI